MIQNTIKFDIRSLLIVLIAFIGNGRAFSIDVVLILVLLTLILQIRDPWLVQRRALPTLFLIATLLLFTIIRTPAIGIPYNPMYALWPIKALVLLALVAFGRDLSFPMGNMLILVLICIGLVLVGQIEGGRLVSVFGPNMLYRIFGFVLFFSAMFNFENRGGARIFLVAFAGFGLYAVLLTGSSGGLLVIAIVAVVTILRFWRGLNLNGKLSTIFGTAVILAITKFAQMNDNIGTELFSLGTLSRAFYKISTLETSRRFVGWSDILTRPFSIIGHSYADYTGLWGYGYLYPHNIFLELYAFYGIVGLILVILVMIAAIKSISLISRGDIMAMTFIVIVIGASVSGDLSDNYGAIGLAGGLLARSRFRSSDHGTHLKGASRP